MMKKLQELVLWVGCTVVLVGSPGAHATVELLGAATYSMATGSPTPAGGMGAPGGGLGLLMKLGAKVDFEVDALYLSETYSSLTSTVAQGAAGLRINLGRIVGLSLGGYYNYYLTNPMALSGSDYGAYGGLCFHFPLGSTSTFIIEGRYEYGLSKLTYGVNSITPSNVIGLVGLAFGGSTK